jgi:opacity protein-like surface antigen
VNAEHDGKGLWGQDGLPKKEVTMKKQMIGLLTLVLTLAAAAAAQPVPGKRFELSTGAYFWNVKYKDASESSSILNVPLRFGFYLVRGLEFEPEILLTLPEEGESTGFIFLGNLAYNFKVSETIVPFILAGAGYGNAEETCSIALKAGEGVGVTVIDAGFGVKFLFGKTAALRFEYRFINYSGSETVTYGSFSGSTSYTYDYGRTDHKIFTGISLFF